MSDTSAGGITGRLRLDSSDWDAAIEKAKADAAELGRSNPNVRIDVDSASAQAKLDEVHAVADALGDSSPTITVTANTSEADAWLAATKKLEDSLNSSVADANARLDQMTQAYNDATPATEKYYTASQLARQAQEAEVQAAIDSFRARQQSTNAIKQEESELTKSKAAWEDWTTAVKDSANSGDILNSSVAKDVQGLLKLSDANAKVAAARAALNALQKDGAAADDALAAASRALTSAQVEQAAAAEAVRSAGEGGSSSESSFSGGGAGMMNPGLIAAAIGAAMALIGPLTAEVAALGSGFVGLGGVAVAAFAGISQQITNNTQLGLAYKSSLEGLKTDLTDLETIAAQGVFAGFQTSVSDIQQNLPAITSEVKDMSSYLGQSGSNLIDGLINGLAEAKPLLDEGAQILDRWTGDFDAWTHGSGFQQFLEYTKQELPIVTNDLEQTGAALVSMLTSLSKTGVGNELLSDLALVTQAVAGLLKPLTALDSQLDSMAAKTKALGGSATTWDNITTAWDAMGHAGSMLEGEITNMTNGTIDYAEVSKGLKDMNLAEVIDGVAGAHQRAVQPIRDVNTQLSTEETTAKTATGALQDYVSALSGLDNGQLSASNAQIALDQSVTNFNSSLKQNGKTLDESTAAGQANMSALNGIASSTLQLVSAQAGAKDSQATLSASMADGRAKFIAAAEAAGQTAAQANALADQYGLVPKSVETAFKTSGLEAAEDAATKIANAYKAIPRTVGTNIITTHTDINGNVAEITSTASGTNGTIAKAQGGPVFASNGLMNITGPGSSFSDSIHAMLSNGESVVRAPSAQAYPQFLNAYNQDPTSALKAVMAQGAASSSTPAVYVQNPFTGEYLLAQVANQTHGQVQTALGQEAQIAAAGLSTQAGV